MSWEGVKQWYDQSVGAKGHYYHQQVIIPKTLQLLQIKEGDSLLDLACGQGVMARHLKKGVHYTGVDISPSLIKSAQIRSNHSFKVGDITKPLPLTQTYSHFTCLLALQNVSDPQKALFCVNPHLEKGAKGVIVINHPYFRIPRQSSWQTDESKKVQYRRVDRYMTPMEIPIEHTPSQPKESTLSYHFPLSQLFEWLKEAGFSVLTIQEWVSDKTSSGPKARMENRARQEFPLFLAIHCQKIN